MRTNSCDIMVRSVSKRPRVFVSTHLFLRPVRHQCVLSLWVDVNEDQVTLLDGHQPKNKQKMTLLPENTARSNFNRYHGTLTCPSLLPACSVLK